MSNLPRLKKLYEAFGAQDIPTFLEGVHEDVEWQYGGSITNVPWLVARRGRAGVLEYVKSFLLTDVTYNPKVFLEEGLVCVVLLDIDIIVKANGMRIHEEDAAHIVYFDDQGLIRKFRSRADTAAHERAYNFKPAG